MLVMVSPSLLVLAASHHNAVVLMKLVLGQTGRLAEGVVLWYIVILYSTVPATCSPHRTINST